MRQKVDLMYCRTWKALGLADIAARDTEPYIERGDGMRQNGVGLVMLEARNNSAFVVVACNDMPIVKCTNPLHRDNVPLHKTNQLTAYNPVLRLFYSCQRGTTPADECTFNWYPVYPVEKYNADLRNAAPDNKPILLDFYGRATV